MSDRMGHAGWWEEFRPARTSRERAFECRLFPALLGLPRMSPAHLTDRSAAIDWRCGDTVQACALCPAPPRRAHAALIVGPSDLTGPARWLDVCDPCHAELRWWAGLALDDAEILLRYDETVRVTAGE